MQNVSRENEIYWHENWISLHLASLWNRSFGQLGNGLIPIPTPGQIRWQMPHSGKMPDGCPGRWAHLETLLSRRQCTLNLRTTVTVDWRCLELSLVVITPSCNKVEDWSLSYISHVSFIKYIPAKFLRVNGGRFSRRVRALGFFVKDPTYPSLKVPEDVHSFSDPLLSLLNRKV